MTKFLIRWVINALALAAAVQVVPGIGYSGDWAGLFGLALIFGLLNALVRPLLKLLTCPLILLTLGMFTLVINAGMLLLTRTVGQSLGIGFTVDGFLPALLGSLVISLVSMVMTVILRDELKGKRK